MSLQFIWIISVLSNISSSVVVRETSVYMALLALYRSDIKKKPNVIDKQVIHNARLARRCYIKHTRFRIHHFIILEYSALENPSIVPKILFLKNVHCIVNTDYSL